jgi:hypothetical protein
VKEGEIVSDRINDRNDRITSRISRHDADLSKRDF